MAGQDDELPGGAPIGFDDAPEEAPEPEPPEPPPFTMAEYELQERRESLDTICTALQVARESTSHLGRQTADMAESAATVDAGARTNAATAIVLADTAAQMAQRVREMLDAEPRPAARGGIDVLETGINAGKEIVIELLKGRTPPLLAAAGQVVERFGLDGEPQPATPQPQPQPAPAAEDQEQEAAPTSPVRTDGALPELGVLFDVIPDELKGISLEEMRHAIWKYTREKLERDE